MRLSPSIIHGNELIFFQQNRTLQNEQIERGKELARRASSRHNLKSNWQSCDSRVYFLVSTRFACYVNLCYTLKGDSQK